MPWTKKGLKRAYACNADLVLHLRERRGWTQFQLAGAAHLSERLISKVESGKPISTRAIDLLAGALSLPEEPIYPEDLISDPLKLAKEFVHARNILNQEAFDTMCRLLDEEIVFHIVGDPKVFLFAGVRHGIDDAVLALESFFTILESSDSTGYDSDNNFSYVVEGNGIIASGESPLHPRGESPLKKPMEVTLRMKFRRGKIYYFESIFDTLKGARELAKVRRKKIDELVFLGNYQESHALD